MRFRFRLQTLLELRRREERAAQLALARLEEDRQRLEDRLRGRQQEIDAGKERWREGLVGTIDPIALRQEASAAVAVDRLARGTVLELAGLLKRIVEQRARLVEASRRRRAVELLRERRVEEWRRDESRRETATLDEIGARVTLRSRVAELAEPSSECMAGDA